MGILLRNAWGHLEALQTTDVPLLVEYITGVRKRESAEQDTGQDRDRTGTGQGKDRDRAGQLLTRNGGIRSAA